MTPGSPELLVLGLGNALLGDDGVGLRLLELAAAEPRPNVEYVDGGTQGLALMGLLEGRRAVVILDAVGLGAAPGTVHSLDAAGIGALRGTRAGSAHEGNALGLLQALTLIGRAPARLHVIGIEPAVVATGLGLSPQAEHALPEALARVRALLERLDSLLD